jgi:hypothetical protein
MVLVVPRFEVRQNGILASPHLVGTFFKLIPRFFIDSDNEIIPMGTRRIVDD